MIRQILPPFVNACTSADHPVIMLKFLCRGAFSISLFLIFFYFFGYPSFITYQRKKTMFTEETVSFNNLEPPTITLAMSNSVLFKGWNTNSVENWSNLSQVCDISEEYDKVANCVNENTFNLADVVTKATNAFKTKKT